MLFYKQVNINGGIKTLNINDIVGIIGSLGFPIVMCLLLYKRMDKQDEQHKAEMDRLTDALNNNTLALQELSIKIAKESE